MKAGKLIRALGTAIASISIIVGFVVMGLLLITGLLRMIN